MSRAALVTGASGGIGEAIVEALEREGFRVEGTSRRGGRYPASDAGDLSEIQALAERSGRLDLVVAAAGVSTDALLVSTTAEDLARAMSINAGGVLALARACAPKLRGGAFVAIGSLYARGASGNAAYAASKGALARGIAAMAACEPDIRFITVVPGYVPTQMASVLSAPARQALIDRCPLRREGRPEEIAAAVLFAASAPGLVSGSVLRASGGLKEAP